MGTFRFETIAHVVVDVVVAVVATLLNIDDSHIKQCVTVLFTVFRVMRNSGCWKFDFGKPGIMRKFNGITGNNPEISNC